MAVFGKYQVYYGKIKSELETIKDNFGYTNLSKAFAHWYLANYIKIDEQDIAETIIDGTGDNGIDAITVDKDSMTLYQFKFPDKEKNIEKAIDEKTVLKLFNGYKKLTSQRKPRIANDNFLDFREVIKKENIFNYTIEFVVFNNSFSQPAEDALENEISEIKETTGNQIKYKVIQQKNICDIYDRMQKKSRIDITMAYKKLDTSYNLGENVKSAVGFLSACELIEACNEQMDVIFDENIRLYEGDNEVNTGIYNTAVGEDSNKFFFYHNGIVMICDNCKNSTGNQTLVLEGASVVNGCQTINSLKKAYDDGKLKEDVYLQFRIIETTDFDLRAKITEYLNSQTKIKDSYFLANNPFIRSLQLDLEENGYFMERLVNEYEYKYALNKIKQYDKKHILKLEKVIQIYAAFYCNEYAARAKRGKGELFDKKIVEVLVSGIDAKKVIHAYEWYEKLSVVLTLYRKCRRSSSLKMDFFDYIDVWVEENDYEEEMNKYIFLNTGDLVVLNAIANLEKKCSYTNEDEYIIEAIGLTKKAVETSAMLPSQATKNNAVFLEIQRDINS
ncbi:MAG: AIPR family protein [Lachnospiraceae bacterium]|nr:AIPR family protein [Lachnospiraceae bacterium]